ncbi:MAG: M20/M25/M40 family metallo-hydrolase [Sediminispirochaetaceae bacterium]
MTKDTLKKRVLGSIDNDKAVRFLQSLIRLPSPSGSPTLTQELVLRCLEQMEMRIDMFRGNSEGVESYPDYCPLPMGEEIDDEAYNLVAVKNGKSSGGKSLMLFSHIDTESPPDDTPGKNPYLGEIIDGRLYGLGAADAKSGIATMILAAEAVLRETDLDGDLILMSILGKKGGSAGTLSAVERGYRAEGAVYLHAAETGHGFQEIKCYSMGTVDLRIIVEGSEGVPNDELDDSEVNAVEKGALIIKALRDWDNERRARLRFDNGSYRESPKTKLHIGLARGGTYVGTDPVSFEIHCRLYFGVGETIETVISDLNSYLSRLCADDQWLSEHPPRIEKMYLRASPACIEENAAISSAVRGCIADVTGNTDIIYQYHGASDIRLPILYGRTDTVGIGPKCGGLYGQEWTDWVDIEDYITGIKIVASLIIDWCVKE